jgi:hypothetical protein
MAKRQERHSNYPSDPASHLVRWLHVTIVSETSLLSPANNTVTALNIKRLLFIICVCSSINTCYTALISLYNPHMRTVYFINLFSFPSVAANPMHKTSSASKKKVRQCFDEYLKFGFIPAPQDERSPFCLLCQSRLTNKSMKKKVVSKHI